MGQRERQTETETDRDRDRDRQAERYKIRQDERKGNTHDNILFQA